MTEKVRTAIIALTVGVVAYFSGSIAHVSNLPSVKTLLGDDSMSALSAASLPHTSSSHAITPKLESGWDDMGRKLYNASVLKLSSIGVKNVTIQGHGPIFVSNEVCGNQNFWTNAAKGGWERMTFAIFSKYVTGNTTVVDFGSWIGPTLLYHGQFSKRSYGIEADPVAYSVAEFNVDLNSKLNPEWGRRISVESACVGRPEDVGFLTMKAGGRRGKASQSMSGINDGKVAKDAGGKAATWQVQCYTLPTIFDFWGLAKPYKDVFIKIDIESYECKLIPSLHDWLKDEMFLPKMFLNYHSQSVADCTDEEWKGLLQVLKLYDHVRIGSDSKIWHLKRRPPLTSS